MCSNCGILQHRTCGSVVSQTSYRTLQQAMPKTAQHRFVTFLCNNCPVDAVAVTAPPTPLAVAVTAPLTTAPLTTASSVLDRPKRVRKPKFVFDPSATPEARRVVAEAAEEIVAESLAYTAENNIYSLPETIIVPTNVTDYQANFYSLPEPIIVPADVSMDKCSFNLSPPPSIVSPADDFMDECSFDLPPPPPPINDDVYVTDQSSFDFPPPPLTDDVSPILNSEREFANIFTSSKQVTSDLPDWNSSSILPDVASPTPSPTPSLIHPDVASPTPSPTPPGRHGWS